MKASYTLIIIGCGQHHQGHSTGNPEKDADHQLKALVAKLQQTGQDIKAAAFMVDDKPEMIVGKAADLSFDTAADAPADPDAVSLDSLRGQLNRLEELLTADVQPGEYEQTGAAGQETEPAVTMEMISRQMAEGQGVILAQITGLGLKIDAARPVSVPKMPKPQGEKRGGRAEKGLPEVPKDAGVDEDGKPGVTGNVPEGALPLPGDPVAQAPEGGWPAPDLPPTTPPPGVVEDTTGDDGAGPTTNEPQNEEEGEEG